MRDALTFGRWVSGRREALRLTQRDVATFSAYAVPTIRKVESNERRPSVELARSLAQALEIDERNEHLFIMCARGDRPVDQLERIPPPRVATALTPHARRSSARGLTVDLDDMPRSTSFFGRHAERSLLSEWLLDPDCRMVVISGIGGLGKTALAANVISTLVGRSDHAFSAVLWRSLARGQSAAELARSLLRPAERARPMSDGETVIDRLLGRFRRERCLLVLDNFESVVRPGRDEDHGSTYLQGFEEFDQLLERLALDHQSVALLTTREMPPTLERLEGRAVAVRVTQLRGIGIDAGLRVLQQEGIDPTPEEGELLVERYSGNPLALRLVADAIREVYGGAIAPFLDTGTPLFDDIRAVLEQQFERLTGVEKAILFELAVADRPIPFPDLAKRLAHAPRPAALLEGARSLHRRSFVEREAGGYSLQHLVGQLVTEQLVVAVAEEIEAGRPDLLATHALVRAGDDDRAIESAVGRLLIPLRGELERRLGSRGLRSNVADLLDRLRAEPRLAESHAAGNLLNLVLRTRPHVPTDFDFARLRLANADLRGVDARDISFAGADLAGSAFTDAFGFVDSVAFSHDGELLAAGTGEGRITLWRTFDQQTFGILTGHTGFVESVAFDPAGGVLASAGAEGTIRLWNLQEMACQQVIHVDGPVYAISFSPDGAFVAAAGKQAGITVVEIPSGAVTNVLPGHGARTFGLAWLPSGLLASGGEDRTVRIWDSATGRCLHELRGHTDVVMSVAPSPDGTAAASAGRDGQVFVWSAETGARLLALSGHDAAVRTVAFSPDGRRIASAGEDRTVRLWDARSGRQLSLAVDHATRVNSIAFSPDGTSLATGSNDATIRVRDGWTGTARRTIQGHAGWVWDAALNADGTMVATVSEDGRTTLWDLSTGAQRAAGVATLQRLKGVAFGRHGDVVATAGADATVRILSTRSPLSTEAELRGERGFTSVEFSPDSEMVAAASYDHLVHIWETRMWRRRSRLAGHQDWVETIAFRPDGSLLASGSHDGEVILWDPRSGERVRSFRDHDDVVTSLAFSSDGRVLASASWDGTIRLQDATTGERGTVLSIPGAWVWGVAFAPGGGTLASASSDHAVCIWDVRTGALRRRLLGHAGPVQRVRYAADGGLISCGGDGTVRAWDIERGHAPVVLRHPEPYKGMDITRATGISGARRENLLALGAVEHDG